MLRAALMLLLLLSACTDSAGNDPTPSPEPQPDAGTGFDVDMTEPRDVPPSDTDATPEPDMPLPDVAQDVPSPEDTTPDPGPEPEPEPEPESFPVEIVTETLMDGDRERPITIRTYTPDGFDGSAAVLLVSHGGQGSAIGHTSMAHLGNHYAARGYVAIHIGHRRSDSNLDHRLDRPADVSFVIDALEQGAVAFGQGFAGQADLARVGHIGHSWGAYTAHAVAGGRFDHGNLGDPRIKAFVALSPQGPEGFGAFDNGPEDNTWGEMALPAFNILGSEEKNGPIGDLNKMEDWRLQPFLRYPDAADKFLAVLPGQNHGNIGGSGSDQVKDYIAQNTRLFFDVYLRGDEAKACEVGLIGLVPAVDFRRKSNSESGLTVGCPEP